MNKNGIILVIIIILIAIGVIFFSMDKPETTPVTDTTIDTTVIVTPQPIATSTATSTPTTPATTTPSVTTHIITYTEAGFTPATITIKQGDVVVFKNNSARGFWPASDEHPSHTIYSAFDPKRVVAAGDSWSFKFDQKGTWEYHDHRAASLVGTVIVQ